MDELATVASTELATPPDAGRAAAVPLNTVYAATTFLDLGLYTGLHSQAPSARRNAQATSARYQPLAAKEHATLWLAREPLALGLHTNVPMRRPYKRHQKHF